MLSWVPGMLIFTDRIPLWDIVSHVGVLPFDVARLQLMGEPVPFSNPAFTRRLGALSVSTSLNEKPPCTGRSGSSVPLIFNPVIFPPLLVLIFNPSLLEIVSVG